MYARMTTLRVDEAHVEAWLSFVQGRVQDALAELAGFRGLAMLLDRRADSCLVASFWMDEATQRASFAALGGLRAEATAILHREVAGEEWESRVVHALRPVAPGHVVRVSRLRLDPDDVAVALDVLEASLVPPTEALEGICALSLWVGTRTDRVITAVVYDGLESLAQTRGDVARIRALGAAKAHMTIESVSEYELLALTLPFEHRPA